MALAPGTRLGVYEVLAPIGRGGMARRALRIDPMFAMRHD